MQINTEYRDDEIYGGVLYLTIEADVVADGHSAVIDLISVQLNGCAGLRLHEIPKDIKGIIEEQVLNEYERHIRENTERKRPGTATRNNGGGSPALGDSVQHSGTAVGI